MRILIPLHTFLPESRFGAELYTYYLAGELRDLGNAVHLFFTARDAATGEDHEVDGLPCTAVPRPVCGGPRSLDARNQQGETVFRSLLNRLTPDIVHVNHLLHLSTRLPLLAKDAGCRVVFTWHDYWMRCPKVKLLDRWGNCCANATRWKCASCVRGRYSRLSWESLAAAETRQASRLKRAVKEVCFQAVERFPAWRRIVHRETEMRAVVAAVDRFVAPTLFLAQRLEEWGIPREKIVQFDYGTKELPYPTRHCRTHGPRLQFGYLGAAVFEKGLHVLLDAFRDYPRADLVLYGGDCAALQEKFGAVLQQPNVRRGGVIDDSQKTRLLPDLDALIVPSVWYENSPLVIHEAFQAGVPVICSNIGGMAELVTHGQDGLHFQAGDARDLRRVLDMCADQPALLEQLRQGVRKPTSMRQHVLDEILPLYHSLKADGRPLHA